MKNPKKSLILLSVLVVLSLTAKMFIPFNLKIIIFMILLIFYAISIVYIIYMLLELNVFHESQGSKLALSKNKLNSNIWD